MLLSQTEFRRAFLGEADAGRPANVISHFGAEATPLRPA
jgi:hypothetical protein